MSFLSILSNSTMEFTVIERYVGPKNTIESQNKAPVYQTLSGCKHVCVLENGNANDTK